MKDYLLGLDAGNTVIKAVIFDRAGSEIAAAAEEGHSRMPQSRAMSSAVLDETLDQCAAVLFAPALTGRSIQPRETSPRLVAPGMATVSMRSIAMARRLLGIQSLDTRASGLVDDMAWQTGVGERTYPIARQRPWPSQTPTLLAWLKRHRPEQFKPHRHRVLLQGFRRQPADRRAGQRGLRHVRRGAARSCRTPLRSGADGGLWSR